MIEGFISRRLSGKLLLMTIGFVMLAELVIFIPSAAMFRQDWLSERAQQAGLLAQALTGVPDYEASEMLTKQFMEDTDVVMMSAKRNGMSEFMLGNPPGNPNIEVVDLREERRLPLFRDAFSTFFGTGEGSLRVLATSPVAGQDALELIIPKAKIKWAMRDYFKRIVYLSLAIAVITGLLIYLAMLGMIIRPIERLAKGLSDFRENPEMRRSNMPPSNRKDEIGQLQREFHDMKQSVRASFKQRERLATLGMAMAKINHDLRNVLTSASAGDTLGNFGVGPRKISFVNNVPSETTVYADSDHTYRVFHNLFRNAAQAMAGMRDDNVLRELTVEFLPSGDDVSILVKDTGPGLPDKAKDNLFKAFASASGHGSTGLGLTISKDLARSQGGDLVLESTSDKGTVFNVTLPIQK